MMTDHISEVLHELHRKGSALAVYKDNSFYNTAEKYSVFTDKLKSTVDEENIRGSVLIATDDEIIWASGTRSVDTDGDIVSPLTIYEIGSVTKTFTASAVFRLVQENRLALSDKVTDFFPDYTNAGDMTIYDLLHMRSGIPDFANEFELFFDMEHKDAAFEKSFWADEVSDAVFLDHLYRLPLKFAPASKTEYSNTNYVLLAMVIEKVTGRSYKECVEDMIFEPLGMGNSSAVSVGDVNSRPEEEEGYHLAQRSARGAGDIHSNTIDMLIFDRAYFAEKVVNKDSLTAMITFDDGYGCGWTSDGFCWWNDENSAEDTDLVFHSGETLSYVCDNIVFNVKGHRAYLIMMSPCFTDAGRKIVELCKEYLR